MRSVFCPYCEHFSYMSLDFVVALAGTVSYLEIVDDLFAVVCALFASHCVGCKRFPWFAISYFILLFVYVAASTYTFWV